MRQVLTTCQDFAVPSVPVVPQLVARFLHSSSLRVGHRVLQLMSDSSRPRRFQFSLRSLLVVVTLICVGPGGYVVHEQRQANREEEAVQKLKMVVGSQLYTRPHWLRTLLARRPAGHVVGVGLVSRETQDSDLPPLAELSELVWLDINDTKLTDRGLIHLAGLTNLERLRLDDTQVSDAGLVHLAKLQRLKTINLHRTQVTDEGIHQLQKAIPGLDIIR